VLAYGKTPNLKIDPLLATSYILSNKSQLRSIRGYCPFRNLVEAKSRKKFKIQKP